MHICCCVFAKWKISFPCIPIQSTLQILQCVSHICSFGKVNNIHCGDPT